MRLKDMYAAAVRVGGENDPRGDKGLARLLAGARKEYEALPDTRRWEFDRERLTNPFADTRILVGDPETEVHRILVGIDMEVGEVLLADRLRERGAGVDLVLAHHPDGRALADLEAVMGVQADIWRKQGVSIAYGDAVMSERMAEIRRAFHPYNNDQAPSAARLLGIPFMCCHTPADNSVNAFLQARCDALDEDATVDDVLEMLKSIPEYRMAVTLGNGPVVYEGDKERRAGRIMVDMTGGTSGPKESIERLAAAGVGTIVGMHMREDHRKLAAKSHMNVVIAGYMASDSLGMNIVVDEFARAGVEVLPCSGYIRVARL
jgi:putative NIF3 family GTP cyclohydrolase 1 type 2